MEGRGTRVASLVGTLLGDMVRARSLDEASVIALTMCVVVSQSMYFRRHEGESTVGHLMERAQPGWWRLVQRALVPGDLYLRRCS